MIRNNGSWSVETRIFFKENSDTMKVDIKGEYVRLTSKEYKILELLICNPQKLFSKKNLFESVWEEEYMYEDKIEKD